MSFAGKIYLRVLSREFIISCIEYVVLKIRLLEGGLNGKLKHIALEKDVIRIENVESYR